MTGWQDLDAATTIRKNLLRAGFLPIPATGKTPTIPGWQDINATETIIDTWFHRYDNAFNTGILTRTTPAVDIDVYDPDVAEAIEALLWEMIGCRGMVRFGRAPKRAVLFRTEIPFKKITTPLFIAPNGTENKVEVLCDGQQIVVFGTHPDTGKDYSWHGGRPGDVARADLPELTEAMAREFIGHAAALLRAQEGWIEKARKPNGNGACHGGGNSSEFDTIYGTRERKYALAALDGCAAELAGMAPGGRNDKLNALAFRLGTMSARGWISRDEAIGRLFEAAIACRMVADDGEAATRATLASGLDNGERMPHPDLADTKDPAGAPPDQSLSLGEWDAGLDDKTPPPRGWLLGNIFCRQFVSSLLGDGGVGKTAVRYAQLISLAIGRSLTGEHVFQRCRVLIVSLEDGVDELRRRIKAVLIHHEIALSELEGWLFLAAPGTAAGKLMTLDQYGRPAPGGLAAKLDRVIIARRIDIVSLDPFVKTHSVEENSNSLIDDVIQILSGLSITHDMAIDTPHHMSKGPPDPGNANRGRGASSAKDGGRLVYTLTPMTPDEAQAFGVSEAERVRLVRMDSGKVNIVPRAYKAFWFRLVSVRIDNGTELYPNGDEVQTVEPWTPPETFAGLTTLLANQILNDIEAGLPDGNRYTDARNAAEDRSAWHLIVDYIPEKKEVTAREIIKAWKKSGLLTSRDYENPATRKTVKGLYVDNTKRPS